MPQFFRTDKVRRHSHLVYVGDDGSGRTSVDRGHSHEVVYREAQEAVIDELTGEVLAEAREAGFEVMPAGKDGHTHELIPFTVEESEESKSKETDEEKLERLRQLFKEAKAYEDEFRRKAEEAEKYYRGEQWKTEHKEWLESRDRAAHTINEIQPKIDLLIGYQRRNRFDIKYYPVEGGDARIADILTTLGKNITEQNNFDYEESNAFEDGAVTGRGLIELYVDYDSNIEGDIRIKRYPWDEAYFGPHYNPDLSDCEYCVKVRWMSFAKVKEIWAEKRDEIQKDIDSFMLAVSQQSDATVVSNTEDYKSIVKERIALDPDYVDIARKEYAVFETWEKKYRRVYIISNPSDGFVLNAEGWSKKDIDAVKTIEGLTVIPRLKTTMHVTRWCGGVILEERDEEFFEDAFNIVPFYAKKRKDKVWGKVEGAMGMQDEINKRHSQITDILNKVCTYGWFYDQQTFLSPQEERKFRQNSSTPGFVQKVADTNRIPVKIEGARFPSEIVQLEQLSSLKMREIMNVPMAMEGKGGASESGIALAEKKAQGLVGNEYLFDNLSLTKRLIGRMLVRLIQKVYTPERIVRVLVNRSLRKEVKIGGRILAPSPDMVEGEDVITPEEIYTLLNEADLTKYDVVVGESPYNPTTRLANFLVWMDAAGKGIPVPPDILVDMSDLPNKDEVKKSIQNMIEQKAREQEATRQMEIQKTLIAAQAKQGNSGGIV